MSGAYDLLVEVEGRNLREVANFVSEKLSPIDAVLSTKTNFTLKNTNRTVSSLKSMRKTTV